MAMTYYNEIIDLIPNDKKVFDENNNLKSFKLMDYLIALVEYDKKTGKMPI
jgi:hypothetical protein